MQLNPLRHQQPAVRHLLLGELLGLLAHALTQLALAWWIATEGGAADLARYGAAVACASLLAMPLLSPLGDRWPKARLIRIAKICLLLDSIALAALAHSGHYSLWLIGACSALSIAAHAVLWPAEASILAELVDAQGLPRALDLRRGAQALGGMLGPGLGGLALATVGQRLTLDLNVLMAGAALLAAWRIRPPPAPVAVVQRQGWFGELAAGLRAKWCIPLDRWWTLASALLMVCLLPVTGMLLPLRVQALGLSAAWFGACSAALSLGLLLGVAGLANTLVARLDRVRALGLALVVCAVAIASIGLCRWAPSLVALYALIGLSLSVTQLAGQTHRMLAMPENFRSRMTAGHLATAQLAAALAPALAGLLLQQAPVAGVYLLLALGFAVASAMLLAVPGLRPFLRLDHEQVRNWYGRQFPQAFVPRR